MQVSNFMKIRQDGAELFHANRRTDRHDEGNSRCSQFCERAEKFNLFRLMSTGCTQLGLHKLKKFPLTYEVLENNFNILIKTYIYYILTF